MTHHVAILIFDNIEVLDFAGPYEVFTTASRVYGHTNPQAEPLFSVQCVARDATPVKARAGLRVLPDATFDSYAAANLLVVPGGVVDEAMACTITRNWIAATSHTASTVASICTGVFLLANSRVVQNGPVTTHWEDVPNLHRMFPGLQVQTDVRWVEQGRTISSAGISAGIDMCLYLVAKLAGQDLALRTARQMDYVWQQTP